MTARSGKAGITAKPPAVTPSCPNLGDDGARTTLCGQPRVATLDRCFIYIFKGRFRLHTILDTPVLDRILDKRSNSYNVAWHKYQTKGRAGYLTHPPAFQSGSTAIIMLQTAKYRKCDDLAGSRRIIWRNRDSLCQSLMRSALVVVLDVVSGDDIEVLLVEHEHVVKTFSA